MADNAISNLVLDIKGERWVSYPSRMKFPRWFAANYPFRGRGFVSRILYCLHGAGLDKIMLKKATPPVISSWLGVDIAFFWPSLNRSTSRFYGYGVKDGKMVEYIKFAIGASEESILLEEAKNTTRAKEISNQLFCVPEVLGVENLGDVLAVRYQPLPEDAHVCPLSDDWIARAREARQQIANCGYMHGDFAWHNFKASGEKLWIVDWEEMRESDNSIIDEICMECGLAYYWRHASIEEIATVFQSKYGRDSRISSMAKAAVEDLAQRKITMGGILKKL